MRKILPKSKWRKKVNFECGCVAEEYYKDEDIYWLHTFCPKHDPTLENEK